jgi:phosphodiesterase/alkaline phosphatase D-like protein
MRALRATVALLAVCLTLAAAGWAQVSAKPGDITVIAGPIPQEVTDTAATIWWETSSPAATIIKYGTDQNNLNQTAQQPWGNQSHSVKITNLQPNTTYYFQVQRPSGEVLKSGSFQTQGSGFEKNQAVRIVDGPRIEFIAQDHAVIAWTTNVPSSAVVHYGTDQNNLGQTAQEPWGQTTHRVTVRGLQPQGTYYFTVESGQAKDNNGETAKSQVGMFQTYVPTEGLKIPYQH